MNPMGRYERELQKNKENRIVTILDAAETLFAKNSIDTTTMQEIADAANLGVATIFRMFPKKEQIAVRIAARRLEKINDLFKNIYNMEITSLEKIEALMNHFLKELLSEKGNDIKMIEDFEIYSMRLSEPIVDIEQYQDVYHEVSKTYAAIIKEGITDGSIRRDIDIEDSLITLMNTFATFARKLSIQKAMFFVELDLAPEEQLRLLKKIVLDYLKNEG